MNERPSRPLVVGGTFDPVHHAHLIVARAAAEQLDADRVLLIPCAQSPLKTQLTSTAPAHHRLEMLRLAVRGDPLFEILAIELQRPPPSYSYDTARQLFELGYPKPYWLIGADQLMALTAWHRAEELVRLVDFVVAPRPGIDLRQLQLPDNLRPAARQLLRLPTFDLSATDIRDRVARHKPIRYLVPDPVADYIHQHGLYRHNPSTALETKDQPIPIR